MRVLLGFGTLCVLSAGPLFAQPAAGSYSPEQAQVFLKTYCQACHNSQRSSGRLDVTPYTTGTDFSSQPQEWNRIFSRVREASMPPQGMRAPAPEEREEFVTWGEPALRASVCGKGAGPGPAPLRRLNRSQYSNTIRDLLNIQFEAGRSLPEDGAGGEGFDNTAETLFLSPIHAEKYLEAAREALGHAFRDPNTRKEILISQSGREVLERFLPRAFRRPVTAADVSRYLPIFEDARKRGDSFDRAVQFTLQAVLISPDFLFRFEPPNPTAEARLLGNFEYASRLSYFLWNSMPDRELLDLAAAGKLQDPEVIKAQIVRMLDPGVVSRSEVDDVRLVHGGKVEFFAQQFIEQWLGTRELGRDIQPDEMLFPQYYDAELRPGIHLEPVLFLKELLVENRSLLNFIDSDFAMLNTQLVKLYGLTGLKVPAQPSHTVLPPDSHRGGLLGMAAVLAVSSYPNRTSPVLRGKWVLEAMLGTPPPPPPPDVPALEDAHPGETAQTLRERLAQHRSNPACTSCHQRIDPLGFALENYDVLGRWREEDNGKPIDAKGELPDGTAFDGPVALKKALMDRKDIFIRHLTTKMLGYALGRTLTLEDSCTVDAIMAKLKQDDYRAQTLLNEIALSAPFRYQSGIPQETRR